MPRASHEHMFVTMGPVDRWHELETFRRSLAMAPPRSPALDREEAMKLVAELQAMATKLRVLRDALRSVMDDRD